MDHQYIDEHNIAERYLLDQVEAEERAAFEEHFIDCPQCVERLELSEGLKQGLNALGTDSSPAAAKVIPMPVSRPTEGKVGRPWFSGRKYATIAAMLVLAAAPTVFFAIRNAELSADLEHARSIADLSEVRTRRLETQLQELETKTLAMATAPAAILSLESIRSAGGPVAILERPQAPATVIILINQESVPEFISYRVTLRDSAVKEVWRAEGLKHQSQTMPLAMALNSSLLRAGRYEMVLEGLTGDGRYAPSGHFSFLVR